MRILILAIGITVVSTSLCLAYNLEGYFPLNQGDAWTYAQVKNGVSSEKNSVIESREIIEGVDIVKRTFPGHEFEWIAIDSEGIKKYKNSFLAESSTEGQEIEMFVSPVMLFPNIALGETKEYAVNSKFGNIEGAQIQYTETNTGEIQILLDAVEDVEVLAGKFSECLKFISVYTWKDSEGSFGEDRCTRWLAHGVGEVKSSCIYSEYSQGGKKEKDDDIQLELISATIGGMAIGNQQLPATETLPAEEREQ